MTKKLMALGALAVAATPSFATDLWNQQIGLPNGWNGAIDDVLTDDQAKSVYQPSDVLVGPGGWNVTTISMEVFAPGPSAALINQAVLNVFANTGQNSLPAVQNDPTLGSTVTILMVPVAGNPGAYFLTASGLNLHWNQGEYWVGLTGLGSENGNAGQIYTGYTNVNSAGANHFSAARNPGGGWGFQNPGYAATDWFPTGLIDGDPTMPNVYDAIDIQGTAAPEPASMALLGLGIVGLINRRRRK